MAGTFKDNHVDHRFEYHVDSHVCYAVYQFASGILTITYVEAPPVLRGSGAAGELMSHIMDAARQNGYKVTPVCSYAVAWMRKHKECHDLLA
jgi:hypothetical protein